MPHIHTEPGQIDFVANIFIVHKNKVLYRLHDKRKIWLMPGGHVELNEVPEQTAVREAFEEVGLHVKLYNPDGMALVSKDEDEESVGRNKDRYLLPPVVMEIHSIDENHRHLGLVYFGTSDTDQVVEPEGVERSGGIVWLTKEEIESHPDLNPAMKKYGIQALVLLAS
jgi:8-oxo-dGTP pyrophosphatase MutT (NUDIX family)